MTWDPLPSTFEKARRREAYRRFASIVTGDKRSGLLGFDEFRDRLRLFEQRYVGIRSIPVKAIVGTASRSNDFDRNWLPLRPEIRERWTSIEKAFPEGGFPPIVVYKVGEKYFVVDGHHRVAVSRARKIEYIDAEITELTTRFEIPDDADIGKLIRVEQQHLFLRDSGLDRARPEANIVLSLPQGYVELLEVVKTHGFHLMMDRGEVLPLEEIAGDFYDNVYLPVVEAIRQEGLADAFPHATDADLFLRIWQRRRTIFPEHGGSSLEEAVQTVSAEEGGRLGAKARRAARRLRQPDPRTSNRSSRIE